MSATRSLFPTFSLLALSVAATAACDGCEDPAAVVEDAGPTHLDPYQGDAGPVVKDESRTLNYQGTSPLELYFGAQTQLAFKLVDAEGLSVPNAAVSLSVVGTAGQLNAVEAATDAAGIARFTFTAGNTQGEVVITATAEHVDVPATAVIRVQVNPYGTLSVSVTSATRIPVTRADVLVWRGLPGTVPTCADLDAALAADLALPTATLTTGFSTLPGQQTFAQQPQGTTVTVRAVGVNARDIEIAAACRDSVNIVGGQNTSVGLQLTQHPTLIEGDYDVRMLVDLGNALPEPYETYVGTVSNILADPAGYAVYQSLKRLDERQGWSFVKWVPPGAPAGSPEVTATYQEVAANPGIFTTWTTARTVVENSLRSRFQQRYDTLTTVGGDIRNALTEFEVGSRFSLERTENTEAGYQVHELWQDLVLEWRYGCTVGDLGCARRFVELDDTTYTPVDSEYGSVVSLAASPTQTERFAVATDAHLFSLNYGAVVMIAMNELVFPSLSEGQANNLEEYLAYLVNCTTLATAVYENLPFGLDILVSEMTIEGLCDGGLVALANTVEGRVLEAQIGGGDPQYDPKELQGALGSGTFYLEDRTHDLVADTVVDLTLQVQWNDPEDEGGPNADLLAPMVGAGRRAATGCDSDSACEAGFFCTPLPHYLQVKAVEMSCERPVGNVLGEQACMSDAQCTTGVCVGESQGVTGTCFSACSDHSVCGSGSCVVDGASVSLDAVLPGLGEQSLNSCL